MLPVRLVIFAKFPEAGLAKTRLIPALGADGAARLAQRLLLHTVAEALAADVGPVELCVTPPPSEADWQSLPLPSQMVWSSQGEGDLGARMARCVRRLVPDGPVVLLGADAPDLTASRLREAVDALAEPDVDAVMTPVTDGGYALLGLKRFDASLFSDIAWSTAEVAEATRSRCRRLQWHLCELPACHDIDEPADLQWLPSAWNPAPGQQL